MKALKLDKKNLFQLSLKYIINNILLLLNKYFTLYFYKENSIAER